MLLRNWKIKIDYAGKPVIVYKDSSSREVILHPSDKDIKLTSEGIFFTVIRRHGAIDYECRFDEFDCFIPPTPVKQLRSIGYLKRESLPVNILSFVYEFVSGVATEATPLVVRKEAFDIDVLLERYSECSQIADISLKTVKETIEKRCNQRKEG